MADSPLAQAYLQKAALRLRVLDLLESAGGYSDVVREAQEAVELVCKAMLHAIGVDPPKWHDVGPLIQEYHDKLPPKVAAQADEIARISRRLRKEREFAFYGEIDFIPTEQYDAQDAAEAIREARWVVDQGRIVISRPPTTP